MGMMDLTKPEHAYFFGLLQSDGTFYETTRNRGRISLELQRSDSAILAKLSEMLPVSSTIMHRDRDTNFKKNYHSDVLCIFDWDFRKEMKSLGLPVGKKHEIVRPPEVPFSEADYYRGLIDGDGSLGTTCLGRPFLSFVTSSEEISRSYLDYIKKITGRVKIISRNERDGIFNIALFFEDAQVFARTLYYHGCISIERKYRLAQEIQSWVRPDGVIRMIKRTWLPEEDEVILKNTPEKAAIILGRTIQSVQMRLWRLRHENDK